MARTRRKSAAELEREIAAYLASTAAYPGRRFILVNHKTGEDMRPAHDFEVAQIQATRYGTLALELAGGTFMVRLRDANEKFAVRRGTTVVSTNASVRGAVANAPASGDIEVCGEYTSDGRHWGIGKGRVVAWREHGRWHWT